MRKYLVYPVLILIVIIGFFIMKEPAQSPEVKFFPPSEIKSSDIVIKITEQGFEPDMLDIKVGQRIVWVNETSDFSWPASNPHPTHTIYFEFDPLEPINKGEAWGFTFSKSGIWGMHDHLKPGNKGVIKVTQ